MRNQLPLYRELLKVTCRPGYVSREQVMKVACLLAGDSRCIALLWLYDELDQEIYLDRIATRTDEDLDETDLERLFVPVEVSADIENAVSDSAEQGLNLPQIQKWLTQNNLTDYESHTIALTSDTVDNDRGRENDRQRRNSEMRVVGVLQLLSARPLNEEADALNIFIEGALTRTIMRRRQQRQLRVMEGIRFDDQLTDSVDDLLDEAANVLVEELSAEMCIFFCKDKDQQLRATTIAMSNPPENSDDNQIESLKQLTGTVAPENSLASQVVASKKENVRVRDFGNSDHHRILLGTSEYNIELAKKFSKHLPNNEIESLIMVPLIIDQHAFGVCVLLNKTKRLARRFSVTDQKILRSACENLSNVIPSVATNVAVRSLSGLELSESIAEESTQKALHDWLTETIPGVYSSVILTYDPRRKGDSESHLFHHLGGEPWFRPAASWSLLNKRPNQIIELPRGGDKRYEYHCAIPSLTPFEGKLIIGLGRSYLSRHEEQLLRFLSADIGHMLRAEFSFKAQHDTLIQIRHVIRSGLTGICNVQVARDMLDRVLETSPDDLSELRKPTFRRLITTAAEYCSRVNILMEESRFLLSDLTPEELRISRHSLLGLVKGIRRTLLSYALKRDVELLIESPYSESQSMVDMDRDLLEIAVFNIVDNAIKYSFRGRRVVIRIRISGPLWSIIVFDHGVYLSPEEQKAAFQPFVRSDGDRRTQGRPGTGLGLAVSNKIIQSHGGKITCDSEKPTHPSAASLTSFTISMKRSLPLENRQSKGAQ